MPTLVLSGKLTKLDGSLRAKAYSFFAKLQDDDTTPGLHIEPITGSADPRVRTGRVDSFLRAVMFKLVGSGHDAEPHYVMHGIWPHDDAIAIAKRVTLRQNPINGVPVIEEVSVKPPAPERVPVPVVPATPLLLRLGYTREQLTDILGVPDDVADAALAVLDEDAGLAVAGAHEGWLGLVLLRPCGGRPRLVDRRDARPRCAAVDR